MGYISRCIGDARAYRDTPSGVSYTSRLPYTRYVWDTPRGVSYTPLCFEASRDTQASPRRPKCLRYVGMSSRHTGCLGDARVYAIHPKCLQMISVFRQVARLYTPVSPRHPMLSVDGGGGHNVVYLTIVYIYDYVVLETRDLGPCWITC